MAEPHTSHSLLERARDPADASSWRKLLDLYTPLIRRWARPLMYQPDDLDDLVQEVFATLVRELPRFHHNRRIGAFRSWLRTITVHRLRVAWQKQAEARGAGALAPPAQLEQLEDPRSPLSLAWDEEHDRHVVQVLLQSIRLEFQTDTWRAFEATVCNGISTDEVAAELGLTPNAVLIAKSRVLKRLRQKAKGLVD